MSYYQLQPKTYNLIVFMASMYCVKCRAKKEVSNPERITMKNGKPALRASCPNCATRMFRIGS